VGGVDAAMAAGGKPPAGTLALPGSFTSTGISPSAGQALREIRGRVPALASKTIVVQRREGILKRRWKVARFGRACDAGDCTEVFVNGPQVMVR
jgi:hypothetical protein